MVRHTYYELGHRHEFPNLAQEPARVCTAVFVNGAPRAVWQSHFTALKPSQSLQILCSSGAIPARCASHSFSASTSTCGARLRALRRSLLQTLVNASIQPADECQLSLIADAPHVQEWIAEPSSTVKDCHRHPASPERVVFRMHCDHVRALRIQGSSAGRRAAVARHSVASAQLSALHREHHLGDTFSWFAAQYGAISIAAFRCRATPHIPAMQDQP